MPMPRPFQPLAPTSSSAAMRVGLDSGAGPMSTVGAAASMDDLWRRRRGGGGAGVGGGVGFGGGGDGLTGILSPLSLEAPGLISTGVGGGVGLTPSFPTFVTGPETVPGTGTGTAPREPLDPTDTPPPPSTPSDPDPHPTDLVPGVVVTSPTKNAGSTSTGVGYTPPASVGTSVRPGVATGFAPRARAPQPIMQTTPSSPLGSSTSAPTATTAFKDGGRAKKRRKRAAVALDARPVQRYASGGRARNWVGTYATDPSNDGRYTYNGQPIWGDAGGMIYQYGRDAQGRDTFGPGTAEDGTPLGNQDQTMIGHQDPRYAAAMAAMGEYGPDMAQLRYNLQGQPGGYKDASLLRYDPRVGVVTPRDNIIEMPDDTTRNMMMVLGAPALVAGGMAMGAIPAGTAGGAIPGASAALETGGFSTVGDIAGTAGANAAAGGSIVGNAGSNNYAGSFDEGGMPGYGTEPGSTFDPYGTNVGLDPSGPPGEFSPSPGGGLDYSPNLPSTPDFNIPNFTPPDVNVPLPDIPGGGMPSWLNSARSVAGLVSSLGGNSGSSGQVQNVDLSGGNGNPAAYVPGGSGPPGAAGNPAARGDAGLGTSGGTYAQAPGGGVDPSLYDFDPNEFMVSGGTGNWQAARSQFQPIESQLFADALKAGSEGEQEAAAGRAAADAAHQTALHKEAAAARLINQGFNPNDPRGPGSEMQRLADLDATKASVGSQNAARLAEKNRGAVLKAQATQIGQADAAQGLSADNIGLQASMSNARTLADLTGRRMQIGAQTADNALDRNYRYADLGERSRLADADRGYRYADLGERTTSDQQRNQIAAGLANNTIANGNTSRNASNRAATGAGWNAIINGAQGVYNLGSTFGFWKDGGRVKRHNDVGLSYANGGTVPIRGMTLPAPAPAYRTGPFNPGAPAATGTGELHQIPDANPGAGFDPWANSRALTDLRQAPTFAPRTNGGHPTVTDLLFNNGASGTDPNGVTLDAIEHGPGAPLGAPGAPISTINPSNEFARMGSMSAAGVTGAEGINSPGAGFTPASDSAMRGIAAPSDGTAAPDPWAASRALAQTQRGGDGVGFTRPMPLDHNDSPGDPWAASRALAQTQRGGDGISSPPSMGPGSGVTAPWGSSRGGMASYGSLNPLHATRANDVGLGSVAARQPAGSGVGVISSPYPANPFARAPRPGTNPRPMAFKKGGRVTKRVKSYESGGAVSGPGTSTSDSIRARLSDGEHVVNAEGTALADEMYPGLLENLNQKGLEVRRTREELMRRLADVGLGD